MHRFSFRTAGVAALLVCAAASLRAQDNCATAVTRAAKSYEIGNLTDVVAIITPCLGSLSSDDAWQAYRLLALSYLFQDQPAKADSAIDAMLRINPRYERNAERDPYEFLRALDRYDWYPQLSVSARVGGALASPNVLRSYTLDPLAGHAATYSGSIGASFGLGMEYHLNRSLALGVEILSVTSIFTRESVNSFSFDTKYTEHLSYFTLPVYARYELHTGVVSPYITAGAFLQFLPSASSSVSGTDAAGTAVNSTSGDIATDRRTAIVPGFLFGAGVQYALGNGTLTGGVRYLHGLVDNIVGTQRYADQTLLYPFYYLDDDLSMRNFEVSIAYLYHLNFRPVKIGGAE